MRSSVARLFRSSTCSRSLLETSCAPKSTPEGLPAVRHHVFKTPLPYLVGLKLQNDIIDLRLAAKAKDAMDPIARQDILLLLEHSPTYTTGRRDGSQNPDELHPEEKKVQHVGAEFHITKRGGQVTYHGPGQLVGYPILDLNAMETPTRCYVEFLQALLAAHLSEDLKIPGILAPHPDGHVGVFASPTEKVASIGIHLRHRITSHGFSLNVTPEPIPWFDLVLACGLDDVRATSIARLLTSGDGSSLSVPSVASTAHALVPRFSDAFNRDFLPLSDATEVEPLQALIYEAEKKAEDFVASHGRWRTEPDVARV